MSLSSLTKLHPSMKPSALLLLVATSTVLCLTGPILSNEVRGTIALEGRRSKFDLEVGAIFRGEKRIRHEVLELEIDRPTQR